MNTSKNELEFVLDTTSPFVYVSLDDEEFDQVIDNLGDGDMTIGTIYFD